MADSSSSTPIAFTDPNLFLSPYCWRLDEHQAAICPVGGGYFKFKVTGTSQIALEVDTSINRGSLPLQMPSVKVVIDSPTQEGLARYVQFPANESTNTPIIIANDLDPHLTYWVRIHAIGGDGSLESGWSGTISQTKINRLLLDKGGIISPAALRPKRALFLGASYEQAYFGHIDPAKPYHTYVDASLSWPFFTAYGLDCEHGQIAIGSQGWVRFGNGGYPPFPEFWTHYDSRHPKTFRADLDYVFIHLAENDNAQPDDAVQAAVAAWIPTARKAFGPSTKIFIVLSLPQIKSEPIKAGVKAVADASTFVLDPGTEFQHAVFAGAPSWAASGDGIHLDAVHQGLYTAFVLKQAQTHLGAKS